MDSNFGAWNEIHIPYKLICSFLSTAFMVILKKDTSAIILDRHLLLQMFLFALDNGYFTFMRLLPFVNFY